MHLLFAYKKLSIITYCFFEGVSMVDFKTTIDYNNILIKAQSNYFATVRVSETHSKRPVCIKVSERYYIVFTLR